LDLKLGTFVLDNLIGTSFITLIRNFDLELGFELNLEVESEI
jgi:hypothetical protein